MILCQSFQSLKRWKGFNKKHRRLNTILSVLKRRLFILISYLTLSDAAHVDRSLGCGNYFGHLDEEKGLDCL